MYEAYIPYVIASIVWIAAIYIGVDTMKLGRDKARKYIQEHKITFDFGIAPESEVIEKFGEEVGQVILDERKLVFYRFGWLWAIIGAFLTQIYLSIIKLGWVSPSKAAILMIIFFIIISWKIWRL